jgi:hypothetical protein
VTANSTDQGGNRRAKRRRTKRIAVVVALRRFILVRLSNGPPRPSLLAVPMSALGAAIAIH